MADAPAALYYPPVGFYFSVEVPSVDGINEGSFQEVSGLNIKLGAKEVEEGGENRFVRKFPVPAKYENLVLKRGMLIGSPLITWAKNGFQQFSFETRMVTIKLLDEDVETKATKILATWVFYNAFPVGIKISDLKAQENAIMVETFELSFDYFEIK